MNQRDADIVRVEVRIVREDAARKVVESAGEFDRRKAAARDHEGQQAFPHRFVAVAIRPFEDVDNVIANADRVEQRFEIERALLDAVQTEVVGNGAERKHHMIVRNPSIIVGPNEAPLEVNFRHAATNDCGAPEVRAERRGDVRCLEAASRNLGQHRCEQQRVRLAHQRQVDRRVKTESAFEPLGDGYAGEATAENDDVRRLGRRFGRRPGRRTKEHGSKRREPAQPEPERDPEQKPAHESGKDGAHAGRRPLRSSAAQNGFEQDIDDNPGSDAERCRRQCRIG